MTKIINNQGEIKIYYVGYKDYISHIITDEYKVEYKYKEDQIISIVDTNGDEVSFDYQNNKYFQGLLVHQIQVILHFLN